MVIGMSNQIAVGSRVKTVKGTEGVVAQILDGGYLLDSGKRVRAQSIAEVEPPEAITPLAVGDTVYYCGDRYWEQFKGMPLVLFELREGLWICEKPDGYRTTNLPARELSRSPVDRPKVKASRSPQKGQWLRDWELEQRQKY
jgi:hypothetical protein